MILLKLCFRNLMRNPMRTLTLFLAIAGGSFLCLFLANLQYGLYSKMIHNGVRATSGHFCISSSEFIARRSSDKTVEQKDALAVLDSVKLKNRFIRLQFQALARSAKNSRPVFVMGINPEWENEHPYYGQKNLLAGEWALNEPKDAVIGYRIAENLGLKIGAKFVVMAQKKQEMLSILLRVKGILKTNLDVYDSGLILMNLVHAQNFSGYAGRIHEAGGMLENDTSVLEQIRDLKLHYPALEIFNYQEALPQIMSMIQLDRANGILIMLFLSLIVGIGLVNGLLISVLQRQREFALLRILGVLPKQLREMILIEAVLLAISGFLFGLACAILAGFYTSTKGIDLSFLVENFQVAGILLDLVLRSGWDFKAMMVIGSGVFGLCLIASLYPAYRCSKIPPLQGMGG